jgi:hypothetical protein
MLCGDHPGPDFGSPYEGVQNARIRLPWIRGPLVLSVGNKLLRVSRPWRSNSFASDLCARIIHVLHVHWKTRSRIMVGFARDEIEERSRLGFCDMPFLASSYRPFSPRFHPTVG